MKRDLKLTKYILETIANRMKDLGSYAEFDTRTDSFNYLINQQAVTQNVTVSNGVAMVFDDNSGLYFRAEPEDMIAVPTKLRSEKFSDAEKTLAQDTVYQHLVLLVEGGFLLTTSSFVSKYRLTWRGHDLLERLSKDGY